MFAVWVLPPACMSVDALYRDERWRAVTKHLSAHPRPEREFKKKFWERAVRAFTRDVPPRVASVYLASLGLSPLSDAHNGLSDYKLQLPM